MVCKLYLVCLLLASLPSEMPAKCCIPNWNILIPIHVLKKNSSHQFRTIMADEGILSWWFHFIINIISRIFPFAAALPPSAVSSRKLSKRSKTSSSTSQKKGRRRRTDSTSSLSSSSEQIYKKDRGSLDFSSAGSDTGGDTTAGDTTDGTDTGGATNEGIYGRGALSSRSRRSSRLTTTSISSNRISKYTVTFSNDSVTEQEDIESTSEAVEGGGNRSLHSSLRRRTLAHSSSSGSGSPSSSRSHRRRSHSNSLSVGPSIIVPRKVKTLVLDLDETLIHSTTLGSRHHDHIIEVTADKVVCLYYIYKRPYVDLFLKKVGLY
jgi:CTD nuclear envelope phosphatase 1